jgi:hypothetical protein
MGCTLRSFLGQNSEPFVQNNNDIRLKDVDLIQINVKRSIEEFTDWVALQPYKDRLGSTDTAVRSPARACNSRR